MNAWPRGILAVALASALMLAGCGGAQDDPKGALIESISSQLQQSGLDEGQVSCMQDELSTWEVSWLEYLDQNFATDISDGPAELNARIAGALASCLS